VEMSLITGSLSHAFARASFIASINLSAVFGDVMERKSSGSAFKAHHARLIRVEILRSQTRFPGLTI